MDCSHAGAGERRCPFSGKPPDWLELWSFGRYNLGLSEGDFWHLTLAQFDALSKRYGETVERQDYHAGLISAVIANVNREKKRRPFTPQDFMPQKKKKQVKSDQELKEQIRMLNAAMGGIEVKRNGK